MNNNNWQKQFLDNGTLLGFGDLSMMIQVVSAILASHDKELVKKLNEEIKNVEYPDGADYLLVAGLSRAKEVIMGVNK